MLLLFNVIINKKYVVKEDSCSTTRQITEREKERNTEGLAGDTNNN
jgi:hypothetical protein